MKALATRQRDYARAVLAFVANEVRSAETRRDDVTRREREAATALEAAREEAAAAEAAAGELADRLGAAEVEMEALRASDAYSHGAALDDLRAEARRLAELVGRDRTSAERAAMERDRATTARSEATAEHELAAESVEVAAGDLRRAAGAVAADGLVGEAAAAPADEAESLVRAWARGRRDLVAEVRDALGAYHGAVAQRRFAESVVIRDDAAVDARRDARRDALAGHAAALEQYIEAVRGWATSCQAVGGERMVDALPEPPDDPVEVTTAVARLAAEFRAEHAVARRDLTTVRESLQEERAGLAAEREWLAAGRIVEPGAPAWRSDRAGRRGGPFWRLVDVAPGVAGRDVDGLESALTAAGLLDAWVDPDGSVEIPEGAADLLLGASPSMRGRAGSGGGPDRKTLGDFLVPLAGAAVDPGVMSAVLASVPVAGSASELPAESGQVVMALDGTFRLGPASGRGNPAPAQLLGSGAQERRRLVRLAEVDAAMVACDGRLDEVARAFAVLAARESATAADLDAVPDGATMIAAAHQVAAAEARLAEAEDRLAASRRALAVAEDGVRQTLRMLTTLGARHELPTTPEGLDEVAEGLVRLERAAEAWVRRRRELAGAKRRLQRAAEDAERAAAAAAEAAVHLAASQRDAADVDVKLATLESAVGAEYREILDRLAGLEGERRQLQVHSRQLAEARPALERRLGVLETRLTQAEAARAEADEHRTATHGRFLAATADGLGGDAGVQVTSAPGLTAVLAAARAVASDLTDVAVDDQVLERLSARVEERLHHARIALGSRVDLTRELTGEGWWLLRATTAGVRRAAADLAAVIAAELDAGRAELAADEERLFEQTLAGSVRHALADRIRLANALVDGINLQLGAVRTAAGGVQVRLRWDVDPDQSEAVKAARALLLREPASLSDAERASLQAFVRARVDQARADLEANASWDARLRETLDYRAWHRFTLQLAHRDWDGFQPATPRRLQRLSTGERSIVLHLPMLASIAGHYADESGASSGCPRLILLDELFAGVDTANRAQLFGTFRKWDLDGVFTSDHEWCQYAALDGIAIHHLHPAVGDGPVTSTRFIWDGQRRSIDPPAA